MRPKRPASEIQFDRKSWWILGLAVLIIVAFCFTLPSLYMGLVRSGYLGDRLPASGETTLLIGLIGLTILFCLYMLHQHAQLVRLRRKLHQDQMELEQSRGRLAELTSLFQLGNSLHMDLPLETVAEITVRRLASSLHSQDVCLFLLDPETRTLSCRARFGLVPRGPEPDVPIGEGAVGWTARTREPLLLRAGECDARFAPFFQDRSDAGSALILPVTVENRCIAVLQACRAAKAETFRLEHRDIAQLFASNVAPVLDRAQAMLRLRQAAAAAGTVAPPAEENAAGAFRDVFLSSATTELKSPLTTIVAYTEVLEQNEGKMTPAMRREFAGRLREEAERMLALVDDVVDLVRLELGRYLLDLRLANVNGVIRQAVDAVQPLIESRGLAVDLDLDPSIPDQHLDP
ncbi:MAG TPA: GAF domain-containing protein, partial [Candidatus Eisenbacteria bacterium]|nr:GAF domain-containing protein [Candidatus Eisenbacteria bacterium]